MASHGRLLTFGCTVNFFNRFDEYVSNPVYVAGDFLRAIHIISCCRASPRVVLIRMLEADG
jgi:hypothetical protein